MDAKVLEAAKAAFPTAANTVTLGAVVHNGECDPEPLVSIPISMMNRHGLIAGATGTGKTRTLQLIAEQLSAAGVPVFDGKDSSQQAGGILFRDCCGRQAIYGRNATHLDR